VAVHDAVRPFIDMETIDKVLDEATETGAAIVGLPAVDTVKQVSRGTGRVLIRATLPREKLVMAQTPQVFRYDLLRRASKWRGRTASSAPTRPAWWSGWMWR